MNKSYRTAYKKVFGKSSNSKTKLSEKQKERCKVTTIKRLANLIRTKSDYHITEWDSTFVAKELIRLNYCKIKD